MKGSGLTVEMRNAIVWLERQPGVTGVVQGRYVRTRHQHQAGFTRVAAATDKHVVVRVYDKDGTKELFAYALPSPARDRWVAALASGDPVAHAAASKAAQDRGKPALPPAEQAAGHATGQLLIPKAINDRAAQLIDVTPELATNWLERNTRNRKLRQSVVNKYAADMKSGRWLVTGDSIAFDTNSSVINGQHRLWAVVESGVTVPMQVTFGLDPDVVAVLDDHLKRNMADVAGIRRPGTSVHSIHTSVANMLLQTSILATAVDRRQALERISRQAQLAALDRHWDAIEFAFRECFRSTKLRSVTVAGVLTPVARAYYTQDRDRLRQFGQVMLHGMADSADDNAAVMLRNFLLRSTTGAVRAVSEVVYRKTERALAAFLERSKIATLYEASNELFPLPEDQPPSRRR